MRRSLLLVLASVSLLLAACSEGGGTSADPDPASTTVAPDATATSSATTIAPATIVAPGTTAAPGELAGALLGPADVGEGFEVLASNGEDEPDELTPCGTPSVQSVVPPLDRAAIDLANRDRALYLTQEVFAYQDDASAVEAMSVGRDGLGCGSGTSTEPDGSTLEFDLTEADLPDGLGDDAFGYQGTVVTDGQSVRAIFVAVQDGRAVSTITFIAGGEDDGPPILPILEIAADKLASVA
jgi:hypothetical protein